MIERLIFENLKELLTTSLIKQRFANYFVDFLSQHKITISMIEIRFKVLVQDSEKEADVSSETRINKEIFRRSSNSDLFKREGYKVNLHL